MKHTYSPAFIRKRKMCMALPVLIFPFLTLTFWSLGGGKGNNNPAIKSNDLHGLNLELPDTHFKDEKTLNKLSYYEKADYDSVKRAEQLRNDPFFKLKPMANADSNHFAKADSNADKIYDRLAELDNEINRKNRDGMFTDLSNDHLPKPMRERNGSAEETGKLNDMMEMIQQSNSSSDPQMDQLSGMLDKIIDIQHPERMNEQLRATSLRQKNKTFPVYKAFNRSSVSLLVEESEIKSRIDTISGHAFYSVAHSNSMDITGDVGAVIHETRTIVDGSIVKLRLSGDIYVDGKLIRKGSFLYGNASLSGERLNIEIPSLRYENSILPVSLCAYDMDGLEGIFIPGSISRDASKESSERIVQGLALNSLNPSVGAQAAGAGIEAAKNLISKKIKRVRVTVKAGYRILLKDKK